MVPAAARFASATPASSRGPRRLSCERRCEQQRRHADGAGAGRQGQGRRSARSQAAEDGEDGAERSAVRHAEHARLGERVAEHALERPAAHGERAADEIGDDGARQADAQHDERLPVPVAPRAVHERREGVRQGTWTAPTHAARRTARAPSAARPVNGTQARIITVRVPQDVGQGLERAHGVVRDAAEPGARHAVDPPLPDRLHRAPHGRVAHERRVVPAGGGSLDGHDGRDSGANATAASSVMATGPARPPRSRRRPPPRGARFVRQRAGGVRVATLPEQHPRATRGLRSRLHGPHALAQRRDLRARSLRLAHGLAQRGDRGEHVFERAVRAGAEHRDARGLEQRRLPRRACSPRSRPDPAAAPAAPRGPPRVTRAADAGASGALGEVLGIVDVRRHADETLRLHQLQQSSSPDSSMDTMRCGGARSEERTPSGSTIVFGNAPADTVEAWSEPSATGGAGTAAVHAAEARTEPAARIPTRARTDHTTRTGRGGSPVLESDRHGAHRGSPVDVEGVMLQRCTTPRSASAIMQTSPQPGPQSTSP